MAPYASYVRRIIIPTRDDEWMKFKDILEIVQIVFRQDEERHGWSREPYGPNAVTVGRALGQLGIKKKRAGSGGGAMMYRCKLDYWPFAVIEPAGPETCA